MRWARLAKAAPWDSTEKGINVMSSIHEKVAGCFDVALFSTGERGLRSLIVRALNVVCV
jgi:hypothetical protein